MAKIQINAAVRLSAAANVSQDELLENVSELSSKEQKFWLKLHEDNVQACSDLLRFLSGMSDGQDRPGAYNVPPISKKTITFLSSYLNLKTYPRLYRGLDELYAVKGSTIKYVTKGLTFWSQKKSWAMDFIGDSPMGGCLSMPFNAKSVLLDMNVIPYCIGPTGREPELILLKGAYSCKVEFVMTAARPRRVA